MTKHLYNIKATSDGFEIAKFDLDLNVESSYALTQEECECPQSHKPTCRHRKMLPLFLAVDRVDTDFFFDFDTKTWHQPLNDGDSGATIEYHDALVERLKDKEEATNPEAVLAQAQPLDATEGEGSILPEPAELEVSVSSAPSVAPTKITRRRLI